MTPKPQPPHPDDIARIAQTRRQHAEENGRDMRYLVDTADLIFAKQDVLIEAIGDATEAIGALRQDIASHREAGDLRGQLVREQVDKALNHHDSRLEGVEKAIGDVKAVVAAPPAEQGAPWRIVYILLGANAMGAVAFLTLLLVVLHLYSQVTGSDAHAAFKDAGDLIPTVTSSAKGAPVSTPKKDEAPSPPSPEHP